jgi:signal transduction histidine kinase
VLGWAGVVVATILFVGAYQVQTEATQPIGEAEVFIAEAEIALAEMAEATDLDIGVRRARNRLDIEAVSVVDISGRVVASTSPNKVGDQIANPLLLDAIENSRLAALAASTDRSVELDGIEEWPPGAVLYQVISPSSDGLSLLLYYNISELLGRRAQPGDIQPETLQLSALGLAIGALAALAMYGRTKAARKYQAMALESRLLRRHSRDLRQKNLELDRSKERAEEALALAEEKIRIRSEFVLMINHELRTPLTSVITGAELMKAADLTEDERETLLQSIVADGQRLLEIINQILTVARIENKGLFDKLSEVGLGDLCSGIGAVLTPTDESPEQELIARTDTAALAMVVNSLTDNARTHGASRVEVRCSTRPMAHPDLEVGSRPEEAIFVSVRDDGPGIDREFLPRIFEKFEKSSFSSGTGLGLYMTRTVVEALGGSIAVATSGLGTTVELAIPLTNAPSRAKAVA